MDDAVGPHELLDDLKRLSQAGRARYMKKLSREDLLAVLSLALEDADKVQEGLGTTDGAAKRSGALTGLHRDQDSETVPSGKSSKRSYESSSTAADKKAKTGAFVAQSDAESEVEADKKIEIIDDDDESVTGIMTRTRNSTVHGTTTQTATTAKSQAHNSVTSMGQTKAYGVRQPKDLPVLLSVPDGNGRASLHSIDELPDAVRSELENRFDAICSLNKTRIRNSRGMRTNAHLRLEKDVCLRADIVAGCRSRAGGYYTLGGEFKKSADDICIEHRCPCAYMIMHNGKCAICIVPLPEAVRVAKEWTELGFWVVDGYFTP